MARITLVLNPFQAQFLAVEIEQMQESICDFKLEAKTEKERAHWQALFEVNEAFLHQMTKQGVQTGPRV